MQASARWRDTTQQPPAVLVSSSQRLHDLKVISLRLCRSGALAAAALISQSVRGERVRDREGLAFFNVHYRLDYSSACVEKGQTFTHGNAAVSAAKSAGRRTPRKGIVRGVID